MKPIAACGALWLCLNASVVLAGTELHTSPSTPSSTSSPTLPDPPVPLTEFELGSDESLSQPLVALLKKYLTVLNRPPQPGTGADLTLQRYAVTRELTDLLATEGYFSPQIDFEIHAVGDDQRVVIKVKTGPLTRVNTVQLSFDGDAVPAALQTQIRTNWMLPKGAVMRDEDWSRAKNLALAQLTNERYAGAKIRDSSAVVQDELADLSVELDSGPVFYLGALHVTGLQHYQPWLVQRYQPPPPGSPYNREGLLKFQRTLQNSPYFATVTVSADPEPDAAAAVPIEVQVTERPRHDIGIGAGYSTNTGARGELSYRDRDFMGQADDLRSVIRIEQLRQVAYADLYFPPEQAGYLDSVGVLGERANISGLVTSTSSFGARRVINDGPWERRFGLSYVFERSTLAEGDPTLAKALVASVGWTQRLVDSALQPRSGYVAQLDISAAGKAVLSDQNFMRFDAKYQHWFPVSARDVLIARLEAGYIAAPSATGIPETYLFRAGGTSSVRGYAYQSLGVNQNGGVTGGRVLATATAEYVHWLEGNWGMAVFVDEGDAADRIATLHLNQGIGAGVRYRTPAGPIALDLGYGREVKKFRLDFSIGIAF